MTKGRLIGILFLFVLLLSACDDTSVSYRILFESNGGSSVSAITTSGNTVLDLPEPPTRPGYVFDGWFFDNNTFEDPFEADSFADTPLISTVTVYAKWQEDETAVYHLVTFITGEGTATAPVNVLEGNLLVLPPDPTRDGFTFAGWSTSATAMAPFNLENPITSPQTLYAFWDAEIVTYEVSYETLGGSSIPSETVESGAFLSLPNAPTKEGHTFSGWYLEETYETLFDFESDPVTNDITLYAHWMRAAYQISYVVEGDLFDPSLVPFEDPIVLPTLPDTPENDGLIIIWYEDQSHTTRFETDIMPASNLTLYGLIAAEPGSTSYDFLRAVPSTTITSRENLSLYFDYMFFNRIPTIDLFLDYDFDTIPEEVSEAFNNRLLQVNVAISYAYFEGGQETTVDATYQDGAVLAASTEDQYVQKNAILSALESDRLSSFDDFAINSIERTYPVETSDQLYYVLEQGYRPIFETPDTRAEMMYEAAKSVLRSIIDDDMTTIQKLDAIYRFLVFDVTYDKALLDKLITNEENINRYNGFYLEGVFTDGRAVCDGISKAFTVLARIEGLDVIRVIGKPADPTNTVLHAWNKVRINGAWYVIDATSANLIINSTYEFFNYGLFMVTDAVMSQTYIQTSHLEIIAETPYDHYETIEFLESGILYDFVIDSQTELNALFRYYDSLDSPTSTIDVRINFDYGESFDDELVAALSQTSMSTILPIIHGDMLILIEQLSP